MSLFRVINHVTAAQHIREYPRATAEPDTTEPLRLAVNQYIPIDTGPDEEKRKGEQKAVTVLATHANGIAKELYEPFWDKLLVSMRSAGMDIRSIWMADMAHSGISGLLNEGLLGNDPSPFDHSRDLLALVNEKRAEMKPPIIGIGHSFGAVSLVHLANLHPRLLSAIILVDPVIDPPSFDPQVYYQPMDVFSVQRSSAISMSGEARARASLRRRNEWPSRKVAIEGLRRNPVFKTWDPKVLERLGRFGFRKIGKGEGQVRKEVLTQENANDDDAPVALTTSPHQEVVCYFRRYAPVPMMSDAAAYRFDRPEPKIAFTTLLPNIRAPTFFLFGDPAADPSVLSPDPADRAAKVSITGTGSGGSRTAGPGAAVTTRPDSEWVIGKVIGGSGHLMLMQTEGMAKVAADIVSWLPKVLFMVEDGWRAEVEMAGWKDKSTEEKTKLDPEYLQAFGADPRGRDNGKKRVNRL